METLVSLEDDSTSESAKELETPKKVRPTPTSSYPSSPQSSYKDFGSAMDSGIKRRRPTQDDLLEKQAMMFGLFGMKSSQVQRHESLNLLYNEPEQIISGETVSVGNIVWTLLFGWWLSLLYLFVAGLLYISYYGAEYSKLSLSMAKYIIWPFGKYIIKKNQSSQVVISGESSGLIISGQQFNLGYYIWMVLYFLFILPFELWTIAITWFFVVSVPISKLNWKLMQLLIKQPSTLAVSVKPSTVANAEVLLYCGEGFNRNYLSYSLFGLNIFFFNAIPIVVLRAVLIIVNLALGGHLLNPVFAFIFDLFCSVPLTYYIGASISSITIQTNYMVGALLNASFGSLTEIILFGLAMNKGALNNLILYALTGGLLNDTLLIPGLSMIAGGLRYKSMKFNSTAAGVGSLLFYVAIIGAFTPTIFYTAFSGFHQQCFNCTEILVNGTKDVNCERCYYLPISHDPLYENGVSTIIIIVMVLLPLTYIIAMIFTFYTHAELFSELEEEAGEAAEWSILVSAIVMSISVITFGLIAEDLVEIVQEVLERLGITQAFLGVTLICLTPAATEIANAVRFALEGQISLSVQIGSASAIQVALVQMPIISLMSYFLSHTQERFLLIFPALSIFSVIIAVLTLIFVCREGYTNYFIGSVLVMMYLMLITTFYFIPVEETFPSPTGILI